VGGIDAVRLVPGVGTPEAETWFVDSLVTFVEFGAHRWFRVQASRGSVWLNEVETSSSSSSSSQQQQQFLFVGPNVMQLSDGSGQAAYGDAVQDMIVSCQPPLPMKKPLRSRAMVTDAEIAAIDTANRTINAGDGWYFDGRNYIGPSGDVRSLHPRIESFIDEFLTLENEAVEAYNNEVVARRNRADLVRSGKGMEEDSDLFIAAGEEATRMGGEAVSKHAYKSSPFKERSAEMDIVGAGESKSSSMRK
jgi:hypothetical protein